MTSTVSAPYGAWPSPLSAARVAAGATPLSSLALDDGDIYWLAGRAAEAGRNTLLRRHGATVAEVTPQPFNVRSRVHEYGGGAYTVADGVVYFSHFADNCLYRQQGGGAPQVLTTAGRQRFADLVLDAPRQRLLAVRELHGAAGTHEQPLNTLCAIGFNGREQVLAAGHDFYSSPRLAPDGRHLAWLCWDHPRMPWQGSELWLAEVDADGYLQSPRRVAGGAEESICQPEWSPQGVLHFVSDRSGWWNLYAWQDEQARALCPLAAEFATPHWTFGNALYGFDASGDIVCSYIEQGVSRLARLPAGGGTLQAIDTPYQEIRELKVGPGYVVLLAGSPTIAVEIARVFLASGELEVLEQSISELPDLGYLSVPRHIDYPSAGGRTAHAFFFPPQNKDVQVAPQEKPPLIVIGHGGPTGMAANTLKLATQFWTSRGFAVLDVNYGGSTGFGRAYRDALKGQWGVVDVEDCVAGARHLAERGLVDSERLIIRGSSAGGLTTLCALTFHDVFKLGASYYGVSDLQGLDDDSHKFESHYNEYLIAPKAEAAARYAERSPSRHTDRLARPMIFFQGLDDKVVPPQQSETMVQALRQRGVPVAYVELAGEGHGFRKAENIIRTLEAELYFYQRMFGLHDPAQPAPVTIDNL
jgi:dipeptidyl aminopeptidase/acylaminoacyl peptidase